MNKKGFTLIELLAVIVILAIIALIATPIVLNIIKDSKQSSGLRSAEMYLDAVEYGIADTIMNNKKVPNGLHTIMENGNICIGTYSNKTCTGDIVEVEVNGEVPEEGSTVTIEEGKIESVDLLYGDKTIIKDNNGNLVYAKKLDDICKYDKSSIVAEKTAGAKYSCEVKPGTSYNFYVLTNPVKGSKTINLIMDQNINGNEITNWFSSDTSETNEYGPLDAMNFLYNETKDWINVDPLNYIYNDKEMQNTEYGYTSFVSTNGILTLTARDEITINIIGTTEEPLRARMPIYSSDASITEVANLNENNKYLHENCDSGGANGYWTLSTATANKVYFVNCDGAIESIDTDCSDNTGETVEWRCSWGGIAVRPVITLKL